MSSPVRRAVEEMVRALNHGSLTELLDTFTDDAVFSADGGTAEGRAELAGLFDQVLTEPRATMIMRSASPRDPADVDPDVDGVLECRMTRRFTLNAGEQVLAHDVEIRCVFTVRDGAVARLVVDPIG